MITAAHFIQAARQRGFALYSGVPCSYFKALINYVIGAKDLRYIAAANEGESVSIAAGAELGGLKSVAMLQNSGLGNAVNPLTSLTNVSQIPLLLIVTLRGDPDAPPDEPQHQRMGQITTALLDLLQIPWAFFPGADADIAAALDRATAHMDRHHTPYALVLRKGQVAEVPTPPATTAASTTPAVVPPPFGPLSATRLQMLRAVQQAALPSDVLVATTGYTCRELYAAGDHENQFYAVGAMGCASSLGLGLAIARPQHRVIVLDGDGAVLMRMGALSTIGFERPRNLIHVVLDNRAYESTGSQQTHSASTDLAAVAAACGYPRVVRVTTTKEMVDSLARQPDELTLIHVGIVPGVGEELPRPAVSPPEVANRLRAYLRRDA
jgi:phosphonopyruvate decarboxylase